MDLGTAAEGMAQLGLATMMIAAWPFWILSLALALQAAIFRERRMAIAALIVVAAIQVFWLASGTWFALMNPLSSDGLSEEGFSVWPVVHWVGLATAVLLAIRGFAKTPRQRVLNGR